MKQIASMKGLLTFLILRVLIFALFVHCHAATSIHYSTSSFNRSNFPDDFVFGAASSAYQFEGAAFEDGRGPSIWDTYTHEHPERISDHSNGDVAVDFYHRYKDDIHSLKELGMDAFRFSISWSRIVPGGKISKGVNHEGVRFYNNLINELIAHGLKPFITLFHWDSPQALDDEYGGWLSPNIVDDYRDYVDFCFKEFGDRVKHWITLNEPGSFTSGGYAAGIYAPGRCSNYTGRCSRGDSATEPYIVAHHLLLAHAAAGEVYKNKYQASQQGKIGVTLSSHWFVPKLKTAAGLKSPSIALDFMLGWFLHPITYGNYPASMRSLVGDRLPKFSSVQSKMLKGSLDFLGLNYYTANYASPTLSVNKVNLSQITDSHTDLTTEKDGVPIGQPTALRWLFIYPKGIRELVLYVKEKYKDPDIYITENGMADLNNSTLSPQEATRDELRIKYHKAHLWNLYKAIKEGAKLKGYFAWSFLDDFEWETGFSSRFGLIYIDYKDGLKRYPKVSAFWFKKFLNGSAK